MRTAVRTRWWLIQRFKNLGYHGPLHGDLKGRATGPFRQTSGGEAVSPAAGGGQRHRYIKPEYLYLYPQSRKSFSGWGQCEHVAPGKSPLVAERRDRRPEQAEVRIKSSRRYEGASPRTQCQTIYEIL